MNTQKIIVDLSIPKKCPKCELRFICTNYFQWVRRKISRLRPFDPGCLIIGTCTIEEEEEKI